MPVGVRPIFSTKKKTLKKSHYYYAWAFSAQSVPLSFSNYFTENFESTGESIDPASRGEDRR